MLKTGGAIITGMAALLAVWWFLLADPLTKTALMQPKGENTAPAYFVVPSEMTEATEHLTRLGFRRYSVEESDHCIFHPLGRSATVHVFADETWRQGTLCVVPKGDQVGEIYWLFQPGAP